MKYERPQISLVGSAIVAVKGVGKGITMPTDNRAHLSQNAYEADE
jgi:hypothetical protein